MNMIPTPEIRQLFLARVERLGWPAHVCAGRVCGTPELWRRVVEGASLTELEAANLGIREMEARAEAIAAQRPEEHAPCTAEVSPIDALEMAELRAAVAAQDAREAADGERLAAATRAALKADGPQRDEA